MKPDYDSADVACRGAQRLFEAWQLMPMLRELRSNGAYRHNHRTPFHVEWTLTRRLLWGVGLVDPTGTPALFERAWLGAGRLCV